MTLTKKDLQNIREVVTDIVEFSVDKSEQRLTAKINEVADDLADFRKETGREISDIAEMNRDFLSKIDNHDTRIKNLEVEAGLGA